MNPALTFAPLFVKKKGKRKGLWCLTIRALKVHLK